MTSKGDPIPEDVREALELAAKALFAWDAIGGDEPTIVVHGSPTLISNVAILAKTYKDMMLPICIGAWSITPIARPDADCRRQS